MPQLALHADPADPQPGASADEAVAQAQRRALQEIRSGKRDLQTLMKLMAPALKARQEELESQAAAKLSQESKPSAKGTKSSPPPPREARSIVDPASVPKEMTFSRASGGAGTHAPTSTPISVPAIKPGGGVDEIQFNAETKPAAPPAKAAARARKK